jgi:predicted Fe-Mo cluster-binding NifX family protein
MKIAFASDDGKSFIDRHFGDSEYYYIYEMKASGIEFIKKIDNTTEEDDEEIHADPVKAKGVTEMLKKEDIKVVIAKVFGPNIKRIRKKFVCILMNDTDISESVKKVQQKSDLILSEWNKGEDRNHINLKVGNE